MATSTWTQAISHADLASFNTWGKKVSDELQLMSGLTKTGDTGQIDWTTNVTYPGTTSYAGYEVYYLNDSLHATAPLYFRLDFGTGNTTVRPAIKLTVGTGSNGSGTITGTALTSGDVLSPTANLLATSTTSYLCVNTGFIGFIGWAGSVSATGSFGPFGFIITRSCDTSGVPDATGALVVTHNNGGNSVPDVYNQSLRFATTAATYTRTNSQTIIFVPGNETTTAISGDPQVFLAWQITPYMQPVHSLCGVLTSEVSFASTFSVTLVGSSHSYMNIDRAIGESINAVTPANWGLAMLWE